MLCLCICSTLCLNELREYELHKKFQGQFMLRFVKDNTNCFHLSLGRINYFSLISKKLSLKSAKTAKKLHYLYSYCLHSTKNLSLNSAKKAKNCITLYFYCLHSTKNLSLKSSKKSQQIPYCVSCT